MSIRTKLFLLILFSSAIPLGIISYNSIKIAERKILEEAGRTSLEYARLATMRIEDHIDHAFDHVLNFSEDISFFEKVVTDDFSRIVMKDSVEIFDDFSYFLIADNNGLIKYATYSSIKGLTINDASIKEAFLGNAQLGDARFDELAGDYTLRITVPIFKRDSNNEVEGALIAGLRWDNVVRMIRGLEIRGRVQDNRQHIMVTDRTGTVIACFDHAEMFRDNLVERGMVSAKLSLRHLEGIIIEKSEHDVMVLSTYTYFKNLNTLTELNWSFLLYQDIEDILAPVTKLQYEIYIIAGLYTLIILIIAYFTSWDMTRPILELVRASEKVGKGDFHFLPVSNSSRDEVGSLVTAFNSMVKDLSNNQSQKEDMYKQLLHTSKLASLGTLSAGVAHEINNPLAIIYGNIFFLKDRLEKDGLHDSLKYVDKMNIAAERIKNIIRGLLKYARADESSMGEINLHFVIIETVGLLEGIYAKQNISIETSLHASKPMIIGNIGEVQQVVMNLISNAQDAVSLRDLKQIKIETMQTSELLILKVSDNGHGIPADILSRIFDPFFTTKEVGKGTGLGLSIVQSIVESLKGKIRVESTLGEGSTFIVEIPQIALPDAINPNLREDICYIPLLRGRALVVDDEREICEIISQILSESGMSVDYALDGEKGLTKARKNNYDVIISDLKMPGLSGAEFIQQAKIESSHRSCYIVMTGGLESDIRPEEQKLIDSGCGLIRKPFSKEDLIKSVTCCNTAW